jgi:hypothetical protein
MLHIEEEQNAKLKIVNSNNNLDKILSNDLPDPLPKHSGFSMLICGSSGSGKTTLLYSILTQKKKDGVRQSYKGLFDKIYCVSPTIGTDSIKNDPFKIIPDNQVYRSLTLEALEKIDEATRDNRDDGKHSLVILDDVGSQMRSNKKIDDRLKGMIQNRRHQYTSYIILLQKFRDAGTGIRANISHFISFRPKNMVERDAICKELFAFNTAGCSQLMSYIFEDDDKHVFLFVDMSSRTTNRFIYYKKFNKLDIKE